MASTYLSKTFSTPTSSKIFTFSFWVKKSQGSQSDDIHIFNNYVSGTSRLTCAIDGNENFKIENNNGSYNLRFITDAEYRDINGFYHFVISVDTTQATESNRVKIYVNGVQETSFSTATYPSQNDDIKVPDASHTMYIGTFTGSAQFWDGIMTHFHFIDGTAYDASTFGETDATTGIWKPKTAPSVTYGTNGFFLKFENSGAFGTDSSGNANNFTVNGTMTQTIDTPSNVFCTLNPLTTDSGVTLSNGNTESDYDASVGNAKGTLAFSSGKYYWEVKIATSASSYPMLGIGSVDEAQMQQPTGGSYPGGFTNSYGAYGNGNVYANGSNTGSQGFTWTTNDIIGIAVDLDSATKTIKWFKNGSEIASYNITNVVSFASIDYNGAEASVNLQYNFGNGYFGTTAVSSAENPDDGIGIFEHTPPTGYKALCTKSINAQEYD
jgi:hypothetical protein